MSSQIPVTGVVPIAAMAGENQEETLRLQALSQEAQQFLASHAWCKSIREFYFGDGIGGIIGIFTARIEPARVDVDEWLWVIVGDLPPAYLVTDDCCNPQQAAEGYIREMRRWVAAAKLGRTSKEIIPVDVPANSHWASALEKRLDALQFDILPKWFAK